MNVIGLNLNSFNCSMVILIIKHIIQYSQHLRIHKVLYINFCNLQELG